MILGVPASRILRVVVPVSVGLAIALLPEPAGLSPAAWKYFALFVSVILGLILEPIPAAGVGFLGVTVAVVSGLLFPDPAASVKWGLSGFSDGTVWLIFGAYMFSLGYEKSGLGRRLALTFVRWLGGSSLGLGYSVAAADLLLAPGMPSNTARSGGTIYPVIRNIPALFRSEPGPTAGRIGTFLMWTAFCATAVTSSMFLTGLAPNLLAISLVRQTTGVEVLWSQWLLGFLPIGIALLAPLPLVTYLVCRPEVKSDPAAREWASRALSDLGPVTGKQVGMGSVVLLAILLWIFANSIIAPTAVVLLSISILFVSGILRWEDIIGFRQAWDVLVWFATLVALADGLNRVGFVEWAATSVATQLSHLPPVQTMAFLVCFFFLVHYLFASLTAHTMAVLPVVLAVGQSVEGMPVQVFSLLLCYSLGLMGVLTPYATGPAPIYYSSGFISRGAFWRWGLSFGLLNLAILLLLGIPWLMLLD